MTLDTVPGVQQIGSVPDSTQLIALLDAHPCDLLVTDYAMPGGQYGDGLELISFLRNRYAGLHIVVLTGMDNAVLIRSLLAFGVHGILSKGDDISHLGAAVQAVQAGRRFFSPGIARQVDAQNPSATGVELSPRESEVIALYLRGAGINAIAEKLGRSKQTISTQKINAMQKLGIDNDADLFKYAVELGLHKVNREAEQ